MPSIAQTRSGHAFVWACNADDAHHAVMRRLRGRHAAIRDDWSEATARAVITNGALDRFRRDHPKISATGAGRVWQGLLQRVRIEGPSPGAHHLPSRAVEALWRSLRSDENDWEVFCDSLGIELDPGLDALTHWVPDDDSEPRRATWSDAFDDELPVNRHPMLFVIDDGSGSPISGPHSSPRTFRTRT